MEVRGGGWREQANHPRFRGTCRFRSLFLRKEEQKMCWGGEKGASSVWCPQQKADENLSAEGGQVKGRKPGGLRAKNLEGQS